MGDDLEGTEGEEMTRLDTVTKNIRTNKCPYDWGLCKPKNLNTLKFDKFDIKTGCRGITCIQCWNIEVQNDKD